MSVIVEEAQTTRMNTKAIRIMLGLGLLAGVAVAREGPQTGLSIKLLMDRSGMTKQIEQIPMMMQMGMLQAAREQGEVGQALAARMKAPIEKHFSAAVLTAGVEGRLRNQISDREADSLATWYTSELGRKISKLEVDAAGQEAYMAVMQQMDELTEPSARLELMKMVDQAADLTESAITFQSGVVASIGEVFQDQMGSGVSDEVLGAQRTRMKKQIDVARPMLEKQMLAMLSYTYRDLSDDEVHKYIEFMESPEGKKFTKVGLHAMLEEIKEGLTSVLASFADGVAP